MPIIYVIEQLINEKWVGVRTNFFNSIKNASIPLKIETALDRTHYTLLGENANSRQSDMTTLLNSISPHLPRCIPIHAYKAIAYKNLPSYKRSFVGLKYMATGAGTNELIGMPPEFDIDKMRFVWWSGDYARTPIIERLYRC